VSANEAVAASHTDENLKLLYIANIFRHFTHKNFLLEDPLDLSLRMVVFDATRKVTLYWYTSGGSF